MAQPKRRTGGTMAGNGKVSLVEQATELHVPDENTFVTAMGFTLRLRPIPAGKIHGAAAAVPVPQPPELPKKPNAGPDDPDYGVVYANEADPGYQREVVKYNETINAIMRNVTLYEGTEIISVPEGKFRPEEDGWIAEAEDSELLMGFAPTVHRTGKLRYVDYLMNYALANADYLELLNHVSRMAGKVLESDVEGAEESFRNPQGRNTDSGNRVSPRPGRR